MKSPLGGVVLGTWQNGVESGTFSGSPTSIGGDTGGGTGSGTGSVYGSLTITGSSQVPNTYTPVTETLGGGAAASEGFVTTSWSNNDPFNRWGLAAAIADNYQGISGSKIIFVEIGGSRFECESGSWGSTGLCSGATFDLAARAITFSDVQLVGPGGIAIMLNGTLNY